MAKNERGQKRGHAKNKALLALNDDFSIPERSCNR